MFIFCRVILDCRFRFLLMMSFWFYVPLSSCRIVVLIVYNDMDMMQ